MKKKLDLVEPKDKRIQLMLFNKQKITFHLIFGSFLLHCVEKTSYLHFFVPSASLFFLNDPNDLFGHSILPFFCVCHIDIQFDL